MEKITFKRGIRRINFPTREMNPLVAIRQTEKLGLPRHRVIAYEFVRYTGEEGFDCVPNVYIEK